MSLQDDLHQPNKGRYMADNIDLAWKIYSQADTCEEDRAVALGFLLYAFDLDKSNSLQHLRKQLAKLMAIRDIHRGNNPEFIPGLSPKRLKLDPGKMVIPATANYQDTNDKLIKKLLVDGELLDVNQNDKMKDRANTHFFRPYGRNRYRVHIYQGLFYQHGKPFDTSAFIAHEKAGYAAFTLNANGELSVFQHEGNLIKTKHSSMNSGSPVVGAGELVIKNGKLITINTYSGHYQPTLFNVYRTLQHFADKGIDLTETMIFTRRKWEQASLLNELPRTLIPLKEGGNDPYYQTPAINFMEMIRLELQKFLDAIKTDTRQYHSFGFKNCLFKTKDLLSNQRLTKDRIELARRFEIIITNLLKRIEIQKTVEEDDRQEILQQFSIEIQNLEKFNNDLSRDHDKALGSGRLGQRITHFKASIESLQQQSPSMAMKNAW